MRNLEIDSLKQTWDDLGKEDPLWAILSVPEKKGNKWDVKEFFDTGDKEINNLLVMMKKQGFTIHTGKVLDFGCGAGRLTQALSKNFDEAIGVDISIAMIDLANEYNDRGNCSFVVNDESDLNLFDTETFDFIYSNITLQHIPPKISKNYIKEFVRIIKPGGGLVFQLPYGNDLTFWGVIFWLFSNKTLNFFRRIFYSSKSVMELYKIAVKDIEQIVDFGGGEILSMVESESAGRGWKSKLYIIQKKM